jgi:hypothetical protein
VLTILKLQKSSQFPDESVRIKWVNPQNSTPFLAKKQIEWPKQSFFGVFAPRNTRKLVHFGIHNPAATETESPGRLLRHQFKINFFRFLK